MITFNVGNAAKSYKDYLVMYKKINGNLKGSLKIDTFCLRLRNNKNVKLPNAKFVPAQSNSDTEPQV